MGRRGARLVLGTALSLAAACGGSAFEAGVEDASVDSADASAPADAGEGSDGPRGGDERREEDAGTTQDVATVPDVAMIDSPFVQPDVIEEPPPHCGGEFACVPAVPSGWSGPVELYSGMGPAPQCGGHFTGPSFDGNQGLDAGAATCGCSCGPPERVDCSSPYTNFQNAVTCSAAGNACASLVLTQGTCTTVDERTACGASLLDIDMGAPGPTGGRCPATPTVDVPPVAWSTAARSCTSAVPPTQLDCPPSSVCAPQPQSSFGASLCIAQPGDNACPAIGYTRKHLFYGGVDDTRGCRACQCGAVTGASCSGDLNVYPSADRTCDGGAVIYPLPFSCSGVQQPGDFRLVLTASGGSCTPSPVSPTGTATPSQPVTFCCAQ